MKKKSPSGRSRKVDLREVVSRIPPDSVVEVDADQKLDGVLQLNIDYLYSPILFNAYAEDCPREEAVVKYGSAILAARELDGSYILEEDGTFFEGMNEELPHLTGHINVQPNLDVLADMFQGFMSGSDLAGELDVVIGREHVAIYFSKEFEGRTNLETPYDLSSLLQKE